MPRSRVRRAFHHHGDVDVDLLVDGYPQCLAKSPCLERSTESDRVFRVDGASPGDEYIIQLTFRGPQNGVAVTLEVDGKRVLMREEDLIPLRPGNHPRTLAGFEMAFTRTWRPSSNGNGFRRAGQRCEKEQEVRRFEFARAPTRRGGSRSSRDDDRGGTTSGKVTVHVYELTHIEVPAHNRRNHRDDWMNEDHSVSFQRPDADALESLEAVRSGGGGRGGGKSKAVALAKSQKMLAISAPKDDGGQGGQGMLAIAGPSQGGQGSGSASTGGGTLVLAGGTRPGGPGYPPGMIGDDDPPRPEDEALCTKLGERIVEKSGFDATREVRQKPLRGQHLYDVVLHYGVARAEQEDVQEEEDEMVRQTRETLQQLDLEDQRTSGRPGGSRRGNR